MCRGACLSIVEIYKIFVQHVKILILFCAFVSYYMKYHIVSFSRLLSIVFPLSFFFVFGGFSFDVMLKPSGDGITTRTRWGLGVVTARHRQF